MKTTSCPYVDVGCIETLPYDTANVHPNTIDVHPHMIDNMAYHLRLVDARLRKVQQSSCSSSCSSLSSPSPATTPSPSSPPVNQSSLPPINKSPASPPSLRKVTWLGGDVMVDSQKHPIQESHADRENEALRKDMNRMVEGHLQEIAHLNRLLKGWHRLQDRESIDERKKEDAYIMNPAPPLPTKTTTPKPAKIEEGDDQQKGEEKNMNGERLLSLL